MTVYSTGSGGVHTVETAEGWDIGGHIYVGDDEYVVLEPTNIVQIAGERLRMVDRKATVGERVIIVSSDKTKSVGCAFRHKIGEAGDVDSRLLDRPLVNGWYILDGDYLVLEPLTAAPLLSEQSAQDQAAATISALALRLDALTERMDALEAKVDAAYATQPTTAVDTEEVLKAVRRFSEGLKRSVSDALKTPQQRRDEIVERAKADVKRLENKHQSRMEFEGAASFWPRGCEKNGKTPCHFVEYVVDRGKRTVVALIRFIKSRRVDYRGVAKCAPNDVFNAHIGKAIALYRALGLEVPAEYLNVPQPTEVRVSDVVRVCGNGTSGIGHYYDMGDVGRVVERNQSEGWAEIYGLRTRQPSRSQYGYEQGVHDADYEVIDDTREEVAA
ncbi:hypothetical protein ACT3XG_14805 [Paenibacillus polymyxa]|uniref:hypothetical protein n=1 Tax=Paenibacillus TaxID=44249 RepID=UPI00142E6236|nr:MULTISPECIES: hypothetical protein [Paenibacillus]KAF6658893.1 hypothetical protein HFD99_01380 [Paenibacillus sp. EKM301P]UBS85426.1 hypothetical protein LAZ93_14760 [Paenibacillus polymyxa]WHX33945.1 hypothetical protein QNH38_15240 [Paenibacillus polymyxa]